MTAKPLAVLYVDDDKDIREIVTLSLDMDTDIDLRTFASGYDALARLEWDAWTPDVMLLDVMMPGLDGRKLIDELRRMPSLRDVPLVFITARARESDVAEYKAKGAADVIVKPFEPFDLADRLRKAAKK
jgi:two-component system, OmpR family, response regulator